MGYLTVDDEREKHHFQRIRRLLRRRNLKPDLEDTWEVHGPHPNMNFQVYVGSAYRDPEPDAQCVCKGSGRLLRCAAHREEMYVVIYPWATFRIDDESSWHDPDPEERIPVER